MQMGAALAVDPLHEDVAARVREEGILSLDTVIECVGKKETMEMAVGLASNRATVMLFGLTSPGAKLEILAFEQIFKKELTITGSYINPLVSQRVIDLIAAKRIDLSKIVTDRIPLRDGVKAFTDQSYRSHGKIVVGDF
jgi:threonine dehydrogenase-like Zn-dependent dehydrogenase